MMDNGKDPPYERRSLVLTMILEFSKWNSIFTDDQMGAAMIDRLAHLIVLKARAIT